MPEVTSHAPGAPSWADLATSDAAGALSFYNALFGWEDDPQEMGPDAYYHMQRMNGLETVALYQQTEATGGTDIPPHWNIYFTVENVDDTMASITQNGGTVVFGPQDVFEAGRMAFCQDPQGAFFAIWQAKQHIGARIKDEAGTMIWNELLTTDREAGIEFYVNALGMERGEVVETIDYAFLKAGGAGVAGVIQKTPEMGEFPPHWSVYFGVDNTDEAVAKAQSLGATVYVPATDIVPVEGQPPIGRFAALADPQGAPFSVFQDMIPRG